MSNLDNNKRIAKNTILLYIRMLITIAIGLYIGRELLNELGVNDYGIYNVVGGIVAMLAFLNSAMTSASQRFISFELGFNNPKKLNIIFCTSVNIHIIIAIIIFILAETIGLWFLNSHMNIAEERMYAANLVYQCSLFTFLFTVISVPYNACIVAHEHMKAFAYISIIDILMKFFIVYSLRFAQFDKLIIYSILLLINSIIIRIINSIYCKKNFSECHFHFYFDKKLFREMFSFAGWSIIGNLGFSFKDQGSNIILNLFYGTSINAARGIALQVNGIISSFSGNFLMAINPQIIKQYASNNILESIQLVYAGCRYSFYLLLIISIPMLINLDYLLCLWLGNVPLYTANFLYLAIIAALFASMSGPLVTAMQATGRIKIFQILICITMLSELPLAYLILKMEFPPYFVMIPTIIVTIIGLFVRFILLKQMINLYSMTYFFINIFIKNIVIALICFFISFYITKDFNDSFIDFIFSSVISFIITLSTIFLLGTSKSEKIFIINRITKKK